MSHPATWQEAVAMPIISSVGSPCPLAPACDLPLVLYEGDCYGSWQVPFTLQSGDIDALFRRFGLWQSSNGLMQRGKTYHSLHRQNHHATTTHPILVGDYLDGQAVTFATNRYNDREKSWSVYVILGDPPLAKELDKANYRYYESLLENQELLASTILDLLKKSFNEILPLCTALGYPIVTTPAKAQLESIILQAKEDFNQAFAEQKEQIWH